ncbi:polymerase [Paenibacillus riograndensis]|uniref:Polymerase n=1 Tax=Paenibacillus riograndensis TaxID=483937 RepID=A0A132TZ64_9BACL|nr:O-antigen ligase family protein [Paenibacillus riograndensis]KWX76639.1 polymerase [Paenibacillus riograndensis]
MGHPVYGKKVTLSKNAEKISSPLWVLITGVILFLLWTPFQVGLFNGLRADYEKPLYISVVICSLMLIVWAGIYYKKFKLEDQRDLLALAVLLLPLTYFLSLFVAASHYMAINMLLIQSMYAALFIVGLYLLRQKQVSTLIQTAIMTVAYLIVWFGLLNWLGAWNVAGEAVGWFSNTVAGSGKYLDAVMTDSNGLRLTSVFQYANTYAGFLMAFLFVAVFALIRSPKWYGTVIHSFMLVPVIVSLLLTLSRGGLVLLPAVFVLLLLFQKPSRQILWIIHLLVAALASLAVIGKVTAIGKRLAAVPDASAAAEGWSWLLIACALTAAISWAVQHFAAPRLEKHLESWSTRKLANLWLPIGATAVVAVAAWLLIGTSARSILPANIETRLENINFEQHSVLERITFYRDAFKVAKDYPVLGAGGGGWAALYEKYQNNPYVSRQAHNFFLQYLIEVGILGFVVFMGFILFVFYKYTKGYIKRAGTDDYDNGFFYLIIALSILVHSILDFNMSYAFMGILVFIALGGMAAAMEAKPLAARWNSSVLRFGYLAVACAAALAVIIVSLRSIGSTNAFAEAMAVAQYSTSYEEIKAPLMKSLKIRPSHPESVILLSVLDNQVYSQTKNEQFAAESLSVLQRGLKDEPNNKQMLLQQIALYDLQGKSESAYAVYRDNLNKYIWDIDWYEPLITRASGLGVQALLQQDKAKQQEYFQTALTTYQEVADGVAFLKTLPPGQLQGRPFSVTPLIALSAGKVKQIAGDTETAMNFIQTGFTGGYADLAGRGDLWSTGWYNDLIVRSFELGQPIYTEWLNLLNTPGVDSTAVDQVAANAKANFNTGIEAYNQVMREANNQATAFSSAATLAFGKMQLLTGNVQGAVTTLKGGLSEDYSDAVNREMARWYLAGLKKLNSTEDQDVYNKLIAADAQEAGLIEQIAGMKPLS